MKICVIITSYIEGDLSSLIPSLEDCFIICADGGYNYSKEAGIVPDLLLGDFDSVSTSLPPDIKTLTFPSKKNFTDTGLCVSTAIQQGFDQILIIGGMGGRMDHTIANLQTMTEAAKSVKSIAIVDQCNYATILKNDTLILQKKQYQYVSLFSLSDQCTGVNITGVDYPLHDHTLTNDFPLGVSNVISKDSCKISVESGTLLVTCSCDR
ncbi:MAG: thiamine diphosphokinase [Anaerovoracaceae bacterium]